MVAILAIPQAMVDAARKSAQLASECGCRGARLAPPRAPAPECLTRDVTTPLWRREVWRASHDH